MRRGEFLSLLGPSGCGKTTALRLLAGFEQPTEGSILIGGVDAVGIPPYRRNVNTVFQHYALFPHMTVLENVAYGLKQRRRGATERTRLAEEALELVQLRGFAGAAAARALGRPAAAGRPGARARAAPARAAARRAARRARPQAAPRDADRAQAHADQLDLTFVYVTHDQEEAMSMSDRIAVMSRGRIEQLDRPLEIYDRPASAFVAGFIGDMNFLEGEVVEAGDRGGWTAAVGPLTVRGLGGARRGATARIGVRPENVVIEPGVAPDGGEQLRAAPR